MSNISLTSSPQNLADTVNTLIQQLNALLFNGQGALTLLAPLTVGTVGYADSGILSQMTGNTNGYQQVVIQNLNSGASASADHIVSNNLGTSGAYYGDFGINSSNYSGTGSYALPNATYLSATGGDLALGTTGVNAIHFFVNTGATDALTIATTGVVSVPAGITVGSTTLLTSSVALTNGAGSSLGTLTNAPAATNPTKWIPINDNGTTRYIPAW